LDIVRLLLKDGRVDLTAQNNRAIKNARNKEMFLLLLSWYFTNNVPVNSFIDSVKPEYKNAIFINFDIDEIPEDLNVKVDERIIDLLLTRYPEGVQREKVLRLFNLAEPEDEYEPPIRKTSPRRQKGYKSLSNTCQCTNKKGEKCKIRVKAGERFCHIHKNCSSGNYSPRAGAGAVSPPKSSESKSPQRRSPQNLRQVFYSKKGLNLPTDVGSIIAGYLD
jgi:hypothetical protein